MDDVLVIEKAHEARGVGRTWLKPQSGKDVHMKGRLLGIHERHGYL